MQSRPPASVQCHGRSFAGARAETLIRASAEIMRQWSTAHAYLPRKSVAITGAVETAP